MTEIIEWSNRNTGFLMALLTAVYVIATIWIVYESRRSNRLAALFEKDKNRPHVIFWIESEMQTHGQNFSMIEFVGKVRNEGASTAHDIKITSSPKLSARQDVDKKIYYTPSFIENTTSILVPKQMLVEAIGPTKYLLEDNEDKNLKFDVLIEFCDMHGEKYSTNYKIDLSRNKSRMFTEDEQAKAYFNLVESVSNAASSLHEINETLNQPDRSNTFNVKIGLELNDRQAELLFRIVKAEVSAEKKGDIWHLSECIGKTSIRRMSAGNEHELDVEAQDVQTLCQAGFLRGYYRNNILWFHVSPFAEREVNEKPNELG